MPVSDWADLMTATVVYKPVTGYDDYGKPSHGAAVSYFAHIAYGTHKVVSRQTGEDALAAITVWLMGVIPTMHVDDQMILPDGTTPRIIDWDLLSDETDIHHMKVHLNA